MLLTQTSEGGWRVPPSLILEKELDTFSIGYYNKSKECLKVVKVLPDPLPQYTFSNDRISQKVFWKEKLSSSRKHCCYIILNTEFKLSCLLCNNQFWV